MELTLYQIDAFANKVFEGNPAAICPLKKWLPDETLQSIASENNLSETAYFVQTANGYHIRWFTPVHEVKLCGHATLASAYVLFDILGDTNDRVDFESLSGILTVKRDGDWLDMDFPAQPPEVCEAPPALISAFQQTPVQCLRAEDYIVVLENETSVAAADPNMEELKKLDLRGVAITSRAEHYDFVTRFFAPKYGINEDPVTGSAFTQLIPYWAQTLNKNSLKARQVSKRGGEVLCGLSGRRVTISGKAVKYLAGKIII